MESRFLEPSVSRTSRYLEPNLVSLGFASLKLYNSTPDFSNPRFLETPDNSNQFWLPWDKLTGDNSNLAKEITNLRERAPELAPETAGVVVECDDDAATFEADPLTNKDIIAEFNHSADVNEEEEEEMDEDEMSL